MSHVRVIATFVPDARPMDPATLLAVHMRINHRLTPQARLHNLSAEEILQDSVAFAHIHGHVIRVLQLGEKVGIQGKLIKSRSGMCENLVYRLGIHLRGLASATSLVSHAPNKVEWIGTEGGVQMMGVVAIGHKGQHLQRSGYIFGNKGSHSVHLIG